MSTQFHRPESTSGEAQSDTETTAVTSASPAAPEPTRAIETDPEPSRPEPFSSLGYDGEEPPARSRHVVDRFDGAIGLFLLRLAVAAVLGAKGLQKAQDHESTEAMLRLAKVPSPEILGYAFGPVQIAIAVALVLGVAVRAAGVGIALSAIWALVTVNWTSGNPLFVADVPGFAGDFQLVLAGIGLMFLGVGGGGFGLDRRFRNRGKAA